MRSIRTLTVGLALAASLSTAAVGLADTANAGPAPPGTHTVMPGPVKGYRTWQAAQKAAGFPLLKPTRTFGLKLRGPAAINVVTCPRVRVGVHGRPDTVVIASYGRARRLAAHIMYLQGIAPRARCPFLPGRRQIMIVAKIRVDGVIGILGRGRGDVCVPGECRSIVIWFLTWTKHRHFYQVMSPSKAGRMRVIGFARSLVPVS